jgi:hypothetical protein
MRFLARLSLVLTIALVQPLPAAQAQDQTGSYPFVYITDDAGNIVQGPQRGNVVPLWPVHSCFGWSVAVPGPDRTVDLVEVQQLAGKTRFDVGPGVTVNPASDTTTRHAREATVNGRLQGVWCVNEADPPGLYRYLITIDGALRAEFTYCAIRLPAGQPVDLKTLACKNSFESS